MTHAIGESALTFLENLAQDSPATPPDGDDRLGRALARLAATRDATLLRRLKRVVDYAIYANELSSAFGGIVVSSGTMQGAAETVAATSEQLSASVAMIGDEVKASREKTHSLSRTANASRRELDHSIAASGQSSDAMRTVVVGAETLARVSGEISSIVATIEGIAMQTKLLALNASVEAARAGASGRGFAVVAREVRALSDQTSEATGNIQTMVGSLQSLVRDISGTVAGAETTSRDSREKLSALNAVFSDMITHVADVDSSLANIANTISEQANAAEGLAASAAKANDLAQNNIERVASADEALSALVSRVGEELADAAKSDVPGKIAHLAKADHVIWKKRLADMFLGRQTLDPNELADHRCCRLGKWYYSVAASPYATLPAFQALADPHQEVHSAGIAAVRAFNAGRRDEALRHMDRMGEASAEVLHLLDALVVQLEQQALPPGQTHAA